MLQFKLRTKETPHQYLHQAEEQVQEVRMHESLPLHHLQDSKNRVRLNLVLLPATASHVLVYSQPLLQVLVRDC